MTSVALMIALPSLPSASPSRSTKELVIPATTSTPLTSTTTSAITPPSVIDLIVPRSWFRALVCIASPSRLEHENTNVRSALPEDPRDRTHSRAFASFSGRMGLAETQDLRGGHAYDQHLRSQSPHTAPAGD